MVVVVVVDVVVAGALVGGVVGSVTTGSVVVEGVAAALAPPTTRVPPTTARATTRPNIDRMNTEGTWVFSSRRGDEFDLTPELIGSSHRQLQYRARFDQVVATR